MNEKISYFDDAIVEEELKIESKDYAWGRDVTSPKHRLNLETGEVEILEDEIKEI